MGIVFALWYVWVLLPACILTIGLVVWDYFREKRQIKNGTFNHKRSNMKPDFFGH